MTSTGGPHLAVNRSPTGSPAVSPDRTTRTLGPAFADLAEIGYLHRRRSRLTAGRS